MTSCFLLRVSQSQHFPVCFSPAAKMFWIRKEIRVFTLHLSLPLSPGTFITEWTDGAKICESFLAGEEEAYRSVAEQLAAIAQFYHFDGWLVNIENALSVSNISPFATFPALLLFLPSTGRWPLD